MTVEKKAISKTAFKHLAIVFGMFGFGYLMVPLYDVVCDIAGLNGKTGRTELQAAELVQVDEQREITVEFVSVINGGGGWEFSPNQASMKVHPGKLYNASYFAKNLSSKDVVGQAVPSLAPSTAAKYFNKTECFCFTRQEFKAGGGRDMPLTFIIDPKIPTTIDTVTLSYTFFNTADKPSGS